MLKDKETLETFNTPLASYAVQHRWHNPDPDSPDFRFQAEYDQSKIIFSNAFRRLSGKSRINARSVRDHFRSRMVHTLEVLEIATQLGKILGLNTELITTISLGHDLGHAPFGFAGELALQRFAFEQARHYVGLDNIDNSELPYCFHHASNSARLLAYWVDQEGQEAKISKETVDGVLKHSWSPWKSERAMPGRIAPFGTPGSYEAQVVAIADQVAAINHDTEDIVDSVDDTHYDLDQFDREMRHWVGEHCTRKGLTKQDEQELLGHFGPTLVDTRKRGSGRKERIENTITGIKDSATAVLSIPGELWKDKDPSEYSIPSPGLYGHFLALYEDFISNLLRNDLFFKWQTRRNRLKVEDVFMHLWETVRSDAFNTGFERLKLTDQRGALGTRRSGPTEYQEHFLSFVQDSYIDPKRPYSLEDEYRITKSELGVNTWVTYLYEKCGGQYGKKDSEFRGALDRLLRLVAIIHFVSGLTDRYCQEISDSLRS